MTTRYVSLLGLGFGDCGKGLYTDFLARQWQAHTVVRFNGGAQAGHNVVLPDGRHHTFSQFCAATLVDGVHTVLSAPVVLHPTALLVENSFLQRIGVQDALSRMLIDVRCRVTTPYHQALGRLRELARGAQAHGTCGVGVGATVAESLDHPETTLRYGDLRSPAPSFQLLESLRLRLLAEMRQQLDVSLPRYAPEMQVLQDASLSERWLQQVAPLWQQVKPASVEQIAQRLHKSGTVLFEGAQGVLLDEWRGFHPHTTWSSISTAAVEAVLRELGINAPVFHCGILRSYLTRHGAGPLPTWDTSLDHLPEPHNASSGWQGLFRRGQPDAVLLRYALQVVGQLDGLLLSHLDVFASGTRLRWCEAYDVPANVLGENTLRQLPIGDAQDLFHQARLTECLLQAQPRYADTTINSAEEFLASLRQITSCPPLFGSYGPTWRDVRQLYF